ncbi:MAG TPA: hypothetical protein VGB74_01470 [Actinoplanes sp.]|jgi:hypothetical protein
MAIIHQATLTPTKLELLADWLPGRAWYPEPTADNLEQVGSCRFDDPAGEVGVEVFIVRDGDGPLVHVPLTYRGAPLADAEHWLVGTMEHSVLGTRWVYDAVGDPVYVAALAETIRTGGHQADEIVETESGPAKRDPLITVAGTGTGTGKGRPGAAAGPAVRVEDGDPAVVVTDTVRLNIRRVLTDHPADEELALTGTLPGRLPGPVVLATLDQ